MKTYSVCVFQGEYWIINWYEYNSLDEIDWEKTKKFCEKNNYPKYGYVYGHNSNNLTSSRNRTIIGRVIKNV